MVLEARQGGERLSLFNQAILDLHDELVIDLFAGGGGASSGLEQAFGRMVDIAVNHDPVAIDLHMANHPQTLHLTSDIFDVDPKEVTQGRKVGFAWFSPDCTFHSKARGGKPMRSKETKRRSLAWVVTRWAGTVRPRIICLENVEEFQDWGPLVGPPHAQRPCKRRRGQTFKQWVKSLTGLGYTVEWRELRSCVYGAPTIRKRLYLIARCDGQPIVWPEATHADPKSVDVQAKKLKTYRTIAECIDWSIPMLSIFATKEEAKIWGKEHERPSPIRPLAENTNRRIARGVKRFVIDNPRPFLVTLAHGEESNGKKRWGATERSIDKPLTSVKCSNGDAVVAPHITKFRSGATGCELTEPMPTITANSHGGECNPGGSTPLGIVAPLICPVTHDGERRTPGADEPLATITTAQRGEQALVAPYLVPRYGEREGQEPRTRSVEEAGPAVVPDGNGGSLAAIHLQTANNSRDPLYGADEPANTIVSDGARHSVVAANLAAYYGAKSDEDVRGGELDEAIHTIPTENRHALVASFLAQNNEGFYDGAGRPLDEPNPTVCANGSLQSLIAANLVELHGTASAETVESPTGAISAQGQHYGLAATHIQRDFGESVGSKTSEPIGTITPNGMGKAALVASFMAKYYGQGVGQEIDEPLHTIPTVDRFGVVTVTINGEQYFIQDIAMRMLQPEELKLAQGFRKTYILDRGASGRKLTKTEQVRMIGNSVSPPVAEAIARANAPELIVRDSRRVA